MSRGRLRQLLVKECLKDVDGHATVFGQDAKTLGNRREDRFPFQVDDALPEIAKGDGTVAQGDPFQAFPSGRSARSWSRAFRPSHRAPSHIDA